MTKLSDGFPMELARQGIVSVVPLGVFFSIDHPEQANTRIGCFHTRAAFSKVLGSHACSPERVAEAFHDHRPVIERMAKALYDCPASSV